MPHDGLSAPDASSAGSRAAGGDPGGSSTGGPGGGPGTSPPTSRGSSSPDSPAPRPVLGAGMVGYAFMGRAHSQAWRTVHHFFDLPVRSRMAVICGRDPAKVEAAAGRLGWAAWETDWKRLITRDDVDLVDVCTPGSSHAEISIAALEAGKHVLCEKPLANTVAEARAMAEAAEAAAARGVRAMVGFNFRRVPAVGLARRLITDGRLGTVRHVRGVYLASPLVDHNFPLLWRLRAEEAGSGALGDLGAHAIDLAQYLVGDRIAGVSALTERFVKRRPLPEGGGTGEVTVDDAALFIARFSTGPLGSFEATRFASGHKEGLRVEVNGDLGSVIWELDHLNDLQFYDGTGEHGLRGFRRIRATEREHPYAAAWWPPGHVIGYEHTFTNEIADLLGDVAAGRDPVPSFADGLAVQEVLDAVLRSAEAGSAWTRVGA
jgi:predicted dehydrogenase